MKTLTATNPPATPWPMARPAVVLAVLTAVLVAWQSRVALLVWAYEGAIAAALLVLCALAGLPLLRLFRLPALPRRWQWLFALGLGIGLASLLVLACGLGGLIGARRRWFAPGLLAVAATIGIFQLARARTERLPPDEPAPPPPGAARWPWWLPALAPFLALLLLVATCPPGVLWQEEGFGYDVLEYHLQLPREYFDAGRIDYLPHNVYANFPAAAEMLYLLGMQATGETVEAWGIAQCFNALLALGFIAAAWAVGRDVSPAAGVLALLAAGSCGWLIYLSGVAYVENGMVLCGFLAAGATARGLENHNYRLVFLGGVLAGCACGFKYPAVALIAAPIAVGMLAAVVPARVRLRALALFAAGGLVAFAPWLVKNLALTGNPVFPLLGERFDLQPAGWGAAEAQHFAEAHQPGPDESGALRRLILLARHLQLEPNQRFGILLFVLAALGAWRWCRPDRRYWMLLAAAQLAVWLVATHLYARFAVPLLIPLLALAARAVRSDGRAGRALATILALGLAANAFFAARLYARHVYSPDGQRLALEGTTGLFTQGILEPYAYLGVINHDLPPDAHILLVGDARPFYVQRRTSYCVVFNRLPLAELVERDLAPAEILDGLRSRGITHLLVHWGEIERLRRSRYGFPPAITRELFAELAAAGLEPLRDFTFPGASSSFATLYRLPARQ